MAKDKKKKETEDRARRFGEIETTHSNGGFGGPGVQSPPEHKAGVPAEPSDQPPAKDD